MDNCGPQDNRPLEARPDVVTFTSDPLGQDVMTIGSVHAEIYLSSDVSHLDIYLRLCDVAPTGVSTNMCEVLRRLTPAEIDRDVNGVFPVTLNLRPVAYNFSAGHRIRLQVSGGAHPMCARNTCSGEPPVDATTLVVAHNAVHHDARYASVIALPIPGEGAT
jgi:putative CocE/NonD family hydrolase